MNTGTQRSASWRRVLAGVAAAAVSVAVLAACAPEPESGATPAPSPAPSSQAPYDGPRAFVGDELASFALTPQEIAGVFPGAPAVGTATDRLIQYSDGGGPVFSPAICSRLVDEPSLRSIGARVVPWEGIDGDASTGAQQILQYPSEEHAAAAMTQLMSTVDQCGEFQADGPGSFVAVTAPEADGVRAFAGTFSADFAGNPWTAHHVFASVGNVLVHLWQPSPNTDGFDAESAALLLRDRAVDARLALVEKLTDEPPQPSPETETADPGAAWSEWTVTPAGVGPLMLGASREAVLGAVPGATVEEFDWATEYVRLRSADGAASVVLRFSAQGQLESITAGVANIAGDEPANGAALPSAGGVRIGAPVAGATTALPGGTFVKVVSSGEYFYRWATRDGQVIDFRADRSLDDPGALIDGITVTAATLAPPAAE